MSRLLLISLLCAFLCAFFIACSSDDSSALNLWFGDQGLATSYGKDSLEIPVSVKTASTGYDSSAYMVSSYAVLGNVNGVERTLYFGLDTLSSEDWRLRPDTVFYNDFYKGVVPDEHKELGATIYWLKEDSTEHDTAWLKFERKIFTDANSANINIGWKDSAFFISLPDGLPKLKSTVKLKLNSNNSVLRIAPPNIADISGLLRVGQKASILEDCKTCLHAGVRESLFVSFAIDEKFDKTVVFAELVLPKSGDIAGSELGLPVPVYVHGENNSENYNRVNVSYVKEHGYSNLVFCEGDSLKLQVTRGLRNHSALNPLPDTLGFSLWLFDHPMHKPDSLSFYNRPAYSRYDFDSGFSGAKLKLWFADYDGKK
jgi:hypothetical protein